MQAVTTAMIVSAFSILLLTTGCGGGAAGGPAGPTGSTPTGPAGQPRPANAVGVTNNQFTPVNLAVPAGATVTWIWDTCSGDGYGASTCVSHNVTFDGGGPHSATQSSGNFARQFPAIGTYLYHCTIHGTSMAGRVVVQ